MQKGLLKQYKRKSHTFTIEGLRYANHSINGNCLVESA